jgi:chromosome segregation ATPase
MTAWGYLLEQLSNCEKARTVAERTGQKGVEQAEAKIMAVTQRIAEVQMEFEKQLQEVRDTSEDQLQEVRTKAEKEVAKAQATQEKAEERIAKADERRTKAEQRSKELEKQVRKLCLQLDMNEQEAERICKEMSQTTDDKVEAKINSTNQRVNDLSQFASEVLQAAHDSMEIMQNQHKDSIKKADERTDSRSRFQEMCALSKMRGDLKMSHKEYEDAKHGLMSTWQRQWTPSARAQFNPPTFLSKTMPANSGSSLAEDMFTRGYQQQSGGPPLNTTLLPSQVSGKQNPASTA